MKFYIVHIVVVKQLVGTQEICSDATDKMRMHLPCLPTSLLQLLYYKSSV